MEQSATFSRKRKLFKLKLPTKYHCFLCLELLKVIKSSKNCHKSTSLETILRHLKINPDKMSQADNLNKKMPFSDEDEVIVDLCNSCQTLVEQFSQLFWQIEKLSMELDHCMDTIHLKASDTAENSRLFATYSRKMKKDPDSLSQFNFIDELRKKILSKSSAIRSCPQTQITLCKVDAPTKPKIEVEAIEESYEELQEELEVEPEVDVNFGCEATEPVSPSPFLEDKIDFASCPSPLAEMHASPVERKVVTRISKRYSFNPSTKTYKCFFCDISLETKNKIKFHFKKYHAPPKELKEKKAKRPPQAPKTRQIDKITGATECIACGKIFKSGSSAVAHYHREHIKKLHKCEICNVATFTILRRLKWHQRTCKMDPKLAKIKRQQTYKHQCETCGRKFADPYSLRLHFNNVHLKERPYFCELCGKRYSSGLSLESHKDKVHFNTRFICQCSQELKDRLSLKKHQKSCPVALAERGIHIENEADKEAESGTGVPPNKAVTEGEGQPEEEANVGEDSFNLDIGSVSQVADILAENPIKYELEDFLPVGNSEVNNIDTE